MPPTESLVKSEPAAAHACGASTSAAAMIRVFKNGSRVALHDELLAGRAGRPPTTSKRQPAATVIRRTVTASNMYSKDAASNIVASAYNVHKQLYVRAARSSMRR